jgi:hypothetical protein
MATKTQDELQTEALKQETTRFMAATLMQTRMDSLFGGRPFLSRVTDVLKEVPVEMLWANLKDQSAREELIRRNINQDLGRLVRVMAYERRKKAKELNSVSK